MVDQNIKEEKESITSGNVKKVKKKDENDTVTLCLSYIVGNGEKIVIKVRRVFK